MSYLWCPESYKNASKGEIEEICNGCGSKGIGGWLVPDTLYGLSITAVCNVHDWMYHHGKTLEDKEKADRVMFNNGVRFIEAKSVWFLKGLRISRLKKYCLVVEKWGGPAYWKGKNKGDEAILL